VAGTKLTYQALLCVYVHSAEEKGLAKFCEFALASASFFSRYPSDSRPSETSYKNGTNLSSQTSPNSCVGLCLN